jgi:probable blue pigment (indigoidine) exporter
VLGVCNCALFFPLLIGAVYRLPGGVAAAAGGVQPLLVACFSWVSVRRRPRTAELVLGLVAAIGVALVVVRPGAQLDPVGIVLALGANVSFAAGVVLTKRFAAPPNGLAATGWQLLIAGAILAPLALALEGAPPSPTPGSVVGLGYLSLVATGAAFLIWFRGVRALPASVPPLLGLAAPITGALLGWLVLEQALSPVQLLGFAITVGAIAYGGVAGGQLKSCVSVPDEISLPSSYFMRGGQSSTRPAMSMNRATSSPGLAYEYVVSGGKNKMSPGASSR